VVPVEAVAQLHMFDPAVVVRRAEGYLAARHDTVK